MPLMCTLGFLCCRGLRRKECMVAQEGFVAGGLNMQYLINNRQYHKSHLPCNCSNSSINFIFNVIVVKAKSV